MESKSDQMIRESMEAAATAASAPADPQAVSVAETERMEQLVQEVKAGLEAAVGPTAEAQAGRSAMGALSGALNRTLIAQGAQGQSARVTIQVLGRLTAPGRVECETDVMYSARVSVGVPHINGEIHTQTRHGVERAIMSALKRNL